MFKKFAYCFFLYLIFCLCQLKAQNSDSLKLVLKNATHDSTRCNILNRLIEAEFDDNVWPRYNEEVIRIAEGHLKNVNAPHTSLDTFYLVTLSGAYSNRGYIAHNK
ncbi:MAG: hypothetical protein ACXVNQ_06585, partial [Bacteroidia bacterium]